MSKVKIGIMGGTFDPIHNGHLILAEQSRLDFDLERVVFIPTGNPPHKDKKVMSPNSYRYDMTLLAINTNPYFDLSPIEMEDQGITYTIDTIKKLQGQYKQAEFYFILGSDSFFHIEKWKDYQELIGLCNFIVVKRPDKDHEDLEARLGEFNKRYKSSFSISQAPLIDISSTDIRRRVRDGVSIKYLLPDPVKEYIHKKRIYKD